MDMTMSLLRAEGPLLCFLSFPSIVTLEIMELQDGRGLDPSLFKRESPKRSTQGESTLDLEPGDLLLGNQVSQPLPSTS
ncbi:hypothetical protein CapIbe_016683 [Capra ibex]